MLSTHGPTQTDKQHSRIQKQTEVQYILLDFLEHTQTPVCMFLDLVLKRTHQKKGKEERRTRQISHASRLMK